MAALPTFLEGVGVVVQACTLIIAIPTLALALTARRLAPTVVVGSIVGAGAMMWAKAAGHWTIDHRGWMVIPIALAIVVVFTVARFARRSLGPELVGASLIGGAIAGWLWQPCVGTRLGDILNRAGEDSALQSVATVSLMLVYTAGALLPVAMLAALPHALPRATSLVTHRLAASVGLLIAALYAGTVAIGQYDDLVGELYRISST